MGFSWTKRQQAAIDHRGNNVIVSAAAGSGKTAILVERTVKLLTDKSSGVRGDRLVIVTFTRKAAAELTARLRASLSAKAEAEPENEYLSEQIMLFHEAQITTTSSYCLHLLRRYGSEAGLPQGFGVLDQTESDMLLSKAADNTLSLMYDKTGGFSEGDADTLFGYFCDDDDQKLKSALISLYKSSRHIPDSVDWIEKQATEYKDHASAEKRILALSSGVFKRMREEIVAIAKDNVLEYKACPDYVIRTLADDLANAERLAQFTDYSDPTLTAAAFGFKWKVMSGPASEKLDKEATGIITDSRDELKKAVKALYAAVSYTYTVRRDIEAVCPVAEAVSRAFGILDRCYNEEKRERGSIDFSDIELTVLKLLQSNKEVREQVRESCDVIIVDEFQDSNDIQYEIYRLIGEEEKKLFVVGDVKQSIYRFRGANSEIFTRVLADTENYTPLHLNENFRSDVEVTAGVNAIFSQIMTPEKGGSTYNAEDALVSAGGRSGGKECRTELCLLDLEDGREQDDGKAEFEAKYIAQRIKSMVSEGFLVYEKDGSSRKCQYGDFAVIVRSIKENAGVFERAFSLCGVPMLKPESGDYLKIGEISLVIDLLTVLDNPYQDLPLLNVMLSPLFSFTADELAVIKSGEKRKAAMFTALHTAERNGTVEKAGKLLDFLAFYSRKADEGSVKRLISDIYDDGVFLPLIAASPNPGKIKADLQLIIHYADVFSQNSGVTLPGFLDYIDSIRDSGTYIKEAGSGSGGNAVSFMSCHASKGLEFPVCFAALLNTRFNYKDAQPDMLMTSSQGLAFMLLDREKKLQYENLYHFCLADEIKRQTYSEEMRILYVTATRARDKLILVGSVKERDIYHRDKHSQLNYIYRSGAHEGQHCALYKEKPADCEQEAGGENDGDIVIDGEMAERIANATKRSYAYEKYTSIPAKLTATQVGVSFDDAIKAEDDEPGLYPRNPAFQSEKTKLTGKERGDAFHKAMYLLDFNGDNAAVQLSRLTDKFTPAELEAIEPEKIDGFLSSAVGERAKRSADMRKEFPVFTMAGEEITGDKASDPEDIPFIQGIVDMFFYEEDGIVLVDYKTNRGSNAQKLIEEYRGQLDIYRKALREMTGNEVKECWLYAFEHGEIRVF